MKYKIKMDSAIQPCPHYNDNGKFIASLWCTTKCPHCSNVSYDDMEEGCGYIMFDCNNKGIINLEEILLTELSKLIETFPEEDYCSIEEMKNSKEFPYLINAIKQSCKQALELAAKEVSNSTGDLEYESENKKLQKSILNISNRIK